MPTKFAWRRRAIKAEETLDNIQKIIDYEGNEAGESSKTIKNICELLAEYSKDSEDNVGGN